MINWQDEFDCAITVCDTEGVILYMNDKSKLTFAKYGDNIIGRNLQEFHGAKSWEMICKMLKNNESNHYTIQKDGVKKIIHQKPWYENGELKGLVEFSFVIPTDMQHFSRD